MQISFLRIIFCYLHILHTIINLIFIVLFATKLIEFLKNYQTLDKNNQKHLKYAVHLTKLTRRKQVNKLSSILVSHIKIKRTQFLCSCCFCRYLCSLYTTELDDLDDLDNLLACIGYVSKH